MPVELHLPDLPEVPISLGPAPGAPQRRRKPWHLWLSDLLSTYLPLLLMAALALVLAAPRPPRRRLQSLPHCPLGLRRIQHVCLQA